MILRDRSWHYCTTSRVKGPRFEDRQDPDLGISVEWHLHMLDDVQHIAVATKPPPAGL